MTIEPHETAFRHGGKGLGSATLDLDELERKAKAACSDDDGPLECTDIGMERVADLEFIAAARAAGGGWVNGAMYGAPTVLALIERVRAAEGALKSCNVANANLVERVLELERLWAEESSARIRKLDLSRKDT